MRYLFFRTLSLIAVSILLASCATSGANSMMSALYAVAGAAAQQRGDVPTAQLAKGLQSYHTELAVRESFDDNSEPSSCSGVEFERGSGGERSEFVNRCPFSTIIKWCDPGRGSAYPCNPYNNSLILGSGKKSYSPRSLADGDNDSIVCRYRSAKDIAVSERYCLD